MYELLLPPTFLAKQNHIFSKSRIKTINWIVNVTTAQMKYVTRVVPKCNKTMLKFYNDGILF